MDKWTPHCSQLDRASELVKTNDKEHAIVTPTDKERHGSLVPVSRDTERMGIGTRVCDQIPIQPQDVHLRRRSVLCESVRKNPDGLVHLGRGEEGWSEGDRNRGGERQKLSEGETNSHTDIEGGADRKTHTQRQREGGRWGGGGSVCCLLTHSLVTLSPRPSLP